MQTLNQQDGWPAEEATEPEGADFVASSPYALVGGDMGTDASSVWAVQGVNSGVETSVGTAVFTSARTVRLEATQVSAIADPSLFEDVTEPEALRSDPDDPDRTIVVE